MVSFRCTPNSWGRSFHAGKPPRLRHFLRRGHVSNQLLVYDFLSLCLTRSLDSDVEQYQISAFTISQATMVTRYTLGVALFAAIGTFLFVSLPWSSE
jgi:hypothetical protein